ncbi:MULTISPECIES: DUF192 domain-containing protein [Paenibacillus]|uniref:DUF192 domain-containing protein n=1 Tax=Paenibacillus TaxID=44249 RepID=UPI0022B8708B|nr:DUF192 domain-containing protein [Paenibacillus caseinilyticus]MCZ8521581.1 DUF192 domain-containing protein [Paenibacillus caseinilyticus]
MKLVNLDTEEILASDLRSAQTFVQRLQGLMFSKELPAGTGLHIRPCRSIHTFFMRYAIDVLYLDEALVIVGMQESLQPGRIGPLIPKAQSVIELPAGSLGQTRTKNGQAVSIQPNLNQT